jgi:hypothetical protein
MRLNSYQVDGKTQKFSAAKLSEIVQQLAAVRLEGLIETSKAVSEMIMPDAGGATIKVGDAGHFESKSISMPALKKRKLSPKKLISPTSGN